MSARKFCTKLATITRRNPTTEAVDTVASNIAVTPLYPIVARGQPPSLTRVELNTPRSPQECFHVPAVGASLPAVEDGDRITHDGAEYALIFAGQWPHAKVPTLHMVVDKVWGT